MLESGSALDFGYPWWLSYGHLAILAPAVLLLWLGVRRAWPKWLLVVLGLTIVWAGAAFAVTRFVIRPHEAGELPSKRFLALGEGRVLDIGAGTGRSTIMVLRERPGVRVVASDLFGESFSHHFGHEGTPQERLMRNLRAAGVAERATVETVDMRALPFEAAAFDGVVSAYAMDHLNREGSQKALSEAARVTKPGGEFLLMLVANEPWARFAFGPLLSHGGLRGAGWWRESVSEAGFQVVEEGTRPMTLYFLARRKQTQTQ